MRIQRLLGFCVCVVVSSAAVTFGSDAASPVSPAEAIKRLEEGNARYAAGKSKCPHADAARMKETAEHGQHPFVAMLACSDSRVPVELIFDQGVGDLFVIRVAGNVCAVDETGTIEYGADHLGTPLVVVLGHSSCGAVTAAAMGAEVHGSTAALVEHIRPAVEKARQAVPNATKEQLLPVAIEDNVWQAIDDLFRQSPTVRERVEAGKLKVVGALYDVHEGRVKWLGEHPEQARLLERGETPPTHPQQ
jgi:carbonic anhydrase